MWSALIILAVSLTTSLCFDCKSTTATSPVSSSGDPYCPPWLDHGDGKCYCSEPRKHKDRIHCDQADGSVQVQTGLCLTWDSLTNRTLLADCPYFSTRTSANESVCHYYIYTVPSTVSHSELNSYVCSPYHRKGLHCGECIEGYGPAPFLNGANIPCADCSKHNYVWMAYLMLHLVMVTVLYYAFLFCEIRGTASPLNVLAYYHQVLINAITSNNFLYAQFICNMRAMGPWYIILTVYSFWNLDFFRYSLQPVCVSSSLSNADVLLFDFIIAFFPVLLTVISYMLIQLHDKGFPVVVCLWRPFHLLTSRYKKDWNPRRSILNTFVTFLLLAYSKFLFTSANLLYGVPVYNNSFHRVRDSPVLYYDTGMLYLGHKHIAYTTLSLVMVVIFVLLPPTLLLLYPTRCFKRCLEKCRFRSWNTLSILMDVFQGWYKDSTNGTADFRALSALYMILRLGFASEFVLVLLFQYRTHYNAFEWTLPSLVHIGLGCLYLTLKPYKKNWMNVVDGLVLILLGVIVVLVIVGDDYTLVLVGLLSSLPTFVVLVYFICKLFKILKVVNRVRKVCRQIQSRIQRLNASYREPQPSLSNESFEHDRYVQSDESTCEAPLRGDVHGSIQDSSMLIEYGTF